MWAKACALALLDQARAARRDFAGILFELRRRVTMFRFPARQPASATCWTSPSSSYRGPTDFAAPLDAAADLLAAEYNDGGRMRGDIVLITDGECEVTEEWMRSWQDRKARLGHRVFGISVGTGPGPVLGALSDHNLRAITDLTTPDAASDIFRVTDSQNARLGTPAARMASTTSTTSTKGRPTDDQHATWPARRPGR